MERFFLLGFSVVVPGVALAVTGEAYTLIMLLWMAFDCLDSGAD